MLTILESADDVVAAYVSGTIDESDLDAVMDRLEAVMAAHDRVHVFVETQEIKGISLAGLPSYIARALPLFGKLGRFGRVAVVADQAWVRAGTRIESALLPNISYHTHSPAERDAAWRWVNNGSDQPEQ